MKLPGRPKKQERIYSKICYEPGCEREFKGYAISKYCDYHRDPKNRVRIRKHEEEVNKNMTFLHDYQNSVDAEFNCERCNDPYRVKIFPKIYIYPKFCERHRSINDRR